MKQTKKKTLIVSLGYEGGCLYYANSLIRNINSAISYDLWVSRSSVDIPLNATLQLPLYRGLFGQLFFMILTPFLFLYTLWMSLYKYKQIVVFGPNNFDGLLLLAFKIIGKTGYLVIHDGIMHLGEKDNWHQKLLNFAMKMASNHIFLTNYVSNLVKNELNICRPSVIIPHGPISYGSPKQHSLKDPFELLVVGRLSKYKGLDIISKILDKLEENNFHLTLAGSISNEYKPLFSNNSSISIIDRYLTDKELDYYLNESDLILMPYIEATQSGIAAMSIAYSKPAVISQVGGLPEQLSKEEAYYMDSLNAKSLLNQIIFAKNNRQDYLSKVECLKMKKGMISWKSLSEKLVRELMNS